MTIANFTSHLASNLIPSNFGYSAEIFTLITFFVSILFLFVNLYYFKEKGLFIFSTTMIIISNIQVLKVAQYSFLSTPIALGTVPFSAIFLSDNILNEYYGNKMAIKCVISGFISYLFFSILMILSILTPDVKKFAGCNFYSEIKTIFSPSVSIFIASLCAYAVGQFFDIATFSFFKKYCPRIKVTLRSFISMCISGLIDNLVFSIVAWKILENINISWRNLILTYVIGGYGFRVLVALLCSPCVKYAKFLIGK